MKIHRIALAAACLAFSSMAANAALTTLSGPWPPAGSSGLDGVLFNVATSAANPGVQVALGAHGYKNGALVPNDGTSTFWVQPGVYPADGKGYANWSFDLAWSLGLNCKSCTLTFGMDTDPTAGVNFVTTDLTPLGTVYADSWNVGMSFIPSSMYAKAIVPGASTGFELIAKDAVGNVLAQSVITVNVVPEPSTWALFGVGLTAMAFMARRRRI